MTHLSRSKVHFAIRLSRRLYSQSIPPIMVKAGTAARLLDMKLSDFRSLVHAGALPQPRVIAPGIERWYFPDLQAIANGTALEEEFEA